MVSFVWEYFSKNADGETAKCKKCNTDIFSKGSTTTMIRHLKQIHSILEKKSTDSGSDRDECSQPPKKKFKQSELMLPKKEVDVDLPFAELIPKDGIPASKILSSRIIQLGLKADGVKPPSSHTTVMNHNHQFYHKQSQLLKNKFIAEKKSGKKWSLSFDEWTSARQRRYLNVNVHDIEHTHCLGMIRVKGSLTSERTEQLIRTKLEQFGLDLDTDIVSTIGDGAKVNIKFGRITSPEFQTCINHGLHLAVLDVLYKKVEQVSDLDTSESESEEDDDNNGVFNDIQMADCEINMSVKSIRKIVKFFKYSDLKNQILQEDVTELFQKELQLILDVKTR